VSWAKIGVVRYFLALIAAVALVAGATKIGYDRFEDEIETRAAPRPTLPGTGTTLPSVLPSENQVVIVGIVSAAHLETALLEPLRVPLTFTTPERGLTASGTLTGVNIDGEDSSIHWDAGTPLQIVGGGTDTNGSLAPGALTFDADASNMVATFPDEIPQGLTPATYTISSPVAVSAGAGLATPHDTVTFEATPTATITFTGGASLTFPTKALSAHGPGKVVLNGSLTVVKPDRSQTQVASVTLDKGPFSITFTPDANGLRIQATLQGTITTA
jgi:hypothetical protein